MRIRHLLIPLICFIFSFAAFSGVFAACIKRDCNPFVDINGCMGVDMAYDDCIRQEKAVKEVKEKAEREGSGKVSTEAPDGAEEPKQSSQYRFMDDIREINKSERKYR
jgi:hypothetical protein